MTLEKGGEIGSTQKLLQLILFGDFFTIYGFPFYGPAAWQRGCRPDLRHVVVPSLQLLQRPVHTNKRCTKKILFATAAHNTHFTLFLMIPRTTFAVVDGGFSTSLIKL